MSTLLFLILDNDYVAFADVHFGVWVRLILIVRVRHVAGCGCGSAVGCRSSRGVSIAGAEDVAVVGLAKVVVARHLDRLCATQRQVLSSNKCRTP